MAGPETTHKIIEEMQIKGADEIVAVFRRLSKAAGTAAAAMGFVKKQTKEAADVLARANAEAAKGEGLVSPPKKAASAFDKAKGAVIAFGKSMAGQFAIASLVTKAIEAVGRAVINTTRSFFEMNLAEEEARNKLAGMIVGLSKFDDGTSMIDRFVSSQKAANVLLDQFGKASERLGIPAESFAESFAASHPVLASLKMDLLQIKDFSIDAAKAAKVMGTSSSDAAMIASKAIRTGVITGESQFANALRGIAKINKGMKVEDRAKAVASAMAQLGAPADAMTGMKEKFVIMNEIVGSIVKKVGSPVFDYIGNVFGRIAKYLQGSGDGIDSFVSGAQGVFVTLSNVAEIVWEVVSGVGKMVGSLAIFWPVFKDVLGAVATMVEFVLTGIRGVSALFDTSDSGFGKLLTISKAIELKWVEIFEVILKVIRSVATLIPFLDKLPGLDGMKESFARGQTSLAATRDKIAGQLLVLEKKNGMPAQSQITRSMRDLQEGKGLTDKEGNDFLKSIKGGLKIQQNIDTIEIKQDFRDGDPDRVLVEFVAGLERIGEAALQSTVGGQITAFEGASAM